MLLMAAFITQACEKPDQEYCWQVIDNLGNDIYQVCGKTQSEMEEDFPNSCNYYKAGDLFCWYTDGGVFIEDRSESYIEHAQQCFGLGNATKVSCDYCDKYYTREKHTYKPTGSFQYSTVRFQQYCGDTAQVLFHGREIILRDTPDSLITVQFSNNGIF